MSQTAHLVILLVSGPAQAARARSGISLARATLLNGAARAVELLLLDDGCDHLSAPATDDEVLRALTQAREDGLPLFACSRSLAQRDLVDAAHALGIKPVGAPVFVPSRAADGAHILVF